MARAYVYDESSKQWIPFSGGGKDAVIDSTLSQSGQAADAKIVGEKLSTLNESYDALIATPATPDMTQDVGWDGKKFVTKSSGEGGGGKPWQKIGEQNVDAETHGIEFTGLSIKEILIIFDGARANYDSNFGLLATTDKGELSLGTASSTKIPWSKNPCSGLIYVKSENTPDKTLFFGNCASVNRANSFGSGPMVKRQDDTWPGKDATIKKVTIRTDSYAVAFLNDGNFTVYGR